ncbi:hypothetical protein H0O03_02035 [Candidatus Micrarchaeota archaeon]|nr:hypothetical protein [Candidatus Micrarchaeota archaeon]
MTCIDAGIVAEISLAPTPTPTATPSPTPTPAPSCSVRSASGTVGTASVSVDYRGMGAVSSSVIHCGNGRDATSVSCAGGVCSGSCSYPNAGRFYLHATLNAVTCVDAGIVAEISLAPTPTPTPTPAPSVAAATPSPTPGLLESIVGSRAPDANISVGSLATRPSVILENVQTHASAMVSSDQPITGVTCDSPTENSESLCNCELTSQGMQGNATTYLADCVISPPVRGRYVIVFTNAAGAKKTAELMLTPGEEAKLQVVQQAQPFTFYAVAAIAVMLFAGGAYLIARKLEDIVTYKQRLIEKRGSILNDMKMLKYRLMKRELDEVAYKKAYDLKQRELAEVEARIAEAEKRAKAKSPAKKGEIGLPPQA